MELVITSRGQAGCAIVAVAGEIDASSVPQLLAVLDQLVAGGERQFVFDLSDVAFCGTEGLTVLICTWKRVALVGGWLRIAAPTSQVRKLLELCGLHMLFEVYPDVASALPPIGLRPLTRQTTVSDSGPGAPVLT